MIEQAHEAEPLGDRNDLARRDAPSRRRAGSASGIRKTPSAGLRIDHRLVSQQDAPLVQRGHDLVGRADIFLPHRLAFDIRLIGEERARAACPWRGRASPARATALRGRCRAWRGAVTPPIVAVTETGPTVVITTSSRTPARKRSAATTISSGEQLRRIDAEFVAGETAEAILGPHPGAQALGDGADHLVGDVVAIGLVDAREIVDRDQEEAAGLPRADRFLQRVFENARRDASG